jgi:hypothetical protein
MLLRAANVTHRRTGRVAMAGPPSAKWQPRTTLFRSGRKGDLYHYATPVCLRLVAGG